MILVFDSLVLHSGPGVLLEGKLLDVSRHAISDDNNQKVQNPVLLICVSIWDRLNTDRQNIKHTVFLSSTGPFLCSVHQTQPHPSEEVWCRREGDRAKLHWHQKGQHWLPHVLLQWVHHNKHLGFCLHETLSCLECFVVRVVVVGGPLNQQQALKTHFLSHLKSCCLLCVLQLQCARQLFNPYNFLALLCPYRGGGQRRVGPSVWGAAVSDGEPTWAAEDHRQAPTQRDLGLLVPRVRDGPDGAGNRTGCSSEDQRKQSFHMWVCFNPKNERTLYCLNPASFRTRLKWIFVQWYKCSTTFGLSSVI